MKPGTDPRAADALAQILDQLRALHDSLTGVIEEKIERMRRADMEGMRNCTTREQELLDRINEREGLRRQVMGRIGRSLGVSTTRARAMTARQLAAKLATPAGERILESVKALKASMNKLALVNRTAGAISGKIVEHLHGVFAAMPEELSHGTDYESQGRKTLTGCRQLFEAVG